MSFKKFSSEQDKASNDNPEQKSKEADAVTKPAKQSGEKTDDVGPMPKT